MLSKFDDGGCVFIKLDDGGCVFIKIDDVGCVLSWMMLDEY